MYDDIVDACGICESEHVSKIAPYRYKSDLFKLCSLYQCSDCKFVFTNPMPNDQALAKYNSSYFENAHNGLSQNKLVTAFHSAINKLRAIYVEQNIEVNSVSRVLEIGGGAGHFAQYWMRNNPCTDYSIVETDKNCQKILEQLNIQYFDEIEKVPEDKAFDLIVMSHVLEHMNSPLNFLSEVSKKLNKGGALFIEVPCNDWQFKEEDEPHLLFFDKKPMKLLLEKSGFKEKTCDYYGETIKELSSGAKESTFFYKVRMKLLQKGVVFPFSKSEGDLKFLDNPLERAMVGPFEAHLKKKAPSSWLRAIAIKC